MVDWLMDDWLAAWLDGMLVDSLVGPEDAAFPLREDRLSTRYSGNSGHQPP
jgi:hypothetical protein